MGSHIRYRCFNCGYSFVEKSGCGFSYHSFCKETAQKMKNGEFGEASKKVLEKYPDAFVECKYVPMKCEQCGEYDSRLSLTILISDKRAVKYSHKCSVCGGKMKVLRNDEAR